MKLRVYFKWIVLQLKLRSDKRHNRKSVKSWKIRSVNNNTIGNWWETNNESNFADHCLNDVVLIKTATIDII